MESTTDRQQRISWWKQGLVESAHIAVVGAGAIGNEVLKNLALLGAGHVHVFDFDKVELSNLSRTVLFDYGNVGKDKATLAAAAAKHLSVNKSASITGHSLDVVWDLGGGYLRRMDIVLGCLDNLEARLSVGRTCYRFGVPYIDGGIRELGGRVQLHLAGFGACMECSIASGERTELNRRYSCFNVIKSLQDHQITPTVQISSAFVAALMCQEAMKFIQGKPVPFGSVISWFGETNDFDVLRIATVTDCPTCSWPPIAQVIELPISSADTAERLLALIGESYTVPLPSAFICGIRCGVCEHFRPLMKPSHKCVDTEVFCDDCKNADGDALSLEKVEYLTSRSLPQLLALSLRELGFPPLSTIFATADNGDLLAFEITDDLEKFPELRKGRSVNA